MSTRTHRIDSLVATILLVALPGLADPATGWLQTAAGTYDYNDPANWVGGVVNGVFGSDLTLAGAQTITFSEDTTLSSGLTCDFGGGYVITFASDGASNPTITLGGNISVGAAAKNCGVTFGSATAASNLTLDFGGGNRTISSSSGNSTVILYASMENGGLTLANTGTVRFPTAQSYAGGTWITGPGLVCFSSNAFGTGPVHLGTETGTIKLNVQGGSNVTFSNNNPFFFEGDINFENNQNKSFNLGAGDITIVRPIKFTVGKNTITFGGQIAGDSPFGIDSVTKMGGATLATAADLILGSPTTLTCTEGTWNFNGILTGDSLVKAGAGTLVLKNTNQFTGDIDIQEGTLAFDGANTLPTSATILVEEGANLGTSSTYSGAALLASGQIDPASTGYLALRVNENNTLDFSAYPTLKFGAAVNSTYSGTITPVNGVYSVGGGTATLTINVDAMSGSADVLLTGNVTVSAENTTTGTVTVPKGYTLTLSGQFGSFPNADIEVDGGTLSINSSSGNGGSTRAKSVRLRSGTLTYAGNKSGDVEDVIAGPLVLDSFPQCGVAKITLTANGKLCTLRASEIQRENGGVAMLSGTNLGLTNEVSSARLMCTTAPTLYGGGGEVGSPDISIYPYLLGSEGNGKYNDGQVTYDVNGFRKLYAEEYIRYLPIGEITNVNVFLPVGTTATNDLPTTINSLFLEGSDPNKGSTGVAGDATLTVLSGVVGLGYHRNNSPRMSCPVDFGTAQGVIHNSQGKGSYWYGALHGSNGAVFFQTAQTVDTQYTGTSLYIDAGTITDSTLYGDIYIHGRLDANAVEVFGRTEDRPTRLFLNGNLSGDNNLAVDSLYGGGRLFRGNNKKCQFVFGYDNSDRLYTGSIESYTILTKVGTGRQRVTGACTHTGKTTIEGGTFQLDGSFANSAVVVTNGATLAGCGTFNQAVTLYEDCTLEVGSAELPDDGEMNFGAALTFSDGSRAAATFSSRHGNRACAVKSTADVLGAVTVPVTVSGEGSGTWLFLEAPVVEPTFVVENSGCFKTVTTDSSIQIWYTRCEGTTFLLR